MPSQQMKRLTVVLAEAANGFHGQFPVPGSDAHNLRMRIGNALECGLEAAHRMATADDAEVEAEFALIEPDNR